MSLRAESLYAESWPDGTGKSKGLLTHAARCKAMICTLTAAKGTNTHTEELDLAGPPVSKILMQHTDSTFMN